MNNYVKLIFWIYNDSYKWLIRMFICGIGGIDFICFLLNFKWMKMNSYNYINMGDRYSGFKFSFFGEFL